MQQQSTAGSRNPSGAAGIPNKVPTPSGPVMGRAPNTGNGQAPGAAIKGFDGGLIPGKV
jgi:hypothetical protein